MDRLTRASSFRNNDNGLNNLEKEFFHKYKEISISEDLDQTLNNWNIPAYSPAKIYKKSGSFIKKTDYVIKTVEQAIPLSEGYNSFGLFSKKLLNLHREKYKFIHVGLVQVALKPATRLGLNTSAIIAVRDKRHNNFHDSLLGVVESTLCDGPMYFSSFPNFTMSLTDPNLLYSICLDIKSEGFNMKPGTQNVILIYRICYKVMNTIISDI